VATLLLHQSHDKRYVIISYNSLLQITLPARRIICVQFESISVAQHQLAKVNHNKGSIFILKMVRNKELWSIQVQRDIPQLISR
jgi:hypothetical protein